MRKAMFDSVDKTARIECEIEKTVVAFANGKGEGIVMKESKNER